MNGRGNVLAIGLIIIGALAALLMVGWGQLKSAFGAATPETIVSASLEALQEQNVLVPFTARFVADPTSRIRKLGLTAQKTLIVPGTVRYEVNLAAITPADVAWDAQENRLTVTLPPLRLSAPEMEPASAVAYRDGEWVMALTDAERALDAANWKAAREEILGQARGATPMKLAQAAAINAVTANFALPLKAAGVNAKVVVAFKKP